LPNTAPDITTLMKQGRLVHAQIMYYTVPMNPVTFSK
jgi:hypothetical protein